MTAVCEDKVDADNHARRCDELRALHSDDRLLVRLDQHSSAAIEMRLRHRAMIGRTIRAGLRAWDLHRLLLAEDRRLAIAQARKVLFVKQYRVTCRHIRLIKTYTIHL